MTRGRRATKVASAGMLLALVTASLGGGPAFGQDDPPVTLRLAVSDDSARPTRSIAEHLAESVATLSNGTMAVDITFDAAATDTERGFEGGTARLLMDGAYDLAVVATRSWGPVGVRGFEALHTPFLIDSDELAVGVARSDLAAGMLRRLEDAGVAGLTLWPEELRHLIAHDECTEPFLDPASVVGVPIRASDRGPSPDLLRTLGAEPVPEFVAGCEVAGFEAGMRQLMAFGGRPTHWTVTGDVTLFPKYQVLAANAASFGRLSEAQQGVVLEAAVRAQEQAFAEYPGEDAAAAGWCAAGGSVVLAGPDRAALFSAAARPLVERLMGDATTADAIRAIEAIKTSLPAPAAPEPCVGEPEPAFDPVEPAVGASPIDGTYIVSLTREELAASPLLYDPGEINDGNWGDLTLTFHEGTFTYELKNPRESYTSSGPYTVDGDLLTVFDENACCPVEPFSFRWRLEGDELILTRDPAHIGPTPWLVKPWTRVPDASLASEDGAQGPTARSEVPPDGTWRIEVTRDAIAAAGLESATVDAVAGVYTWTFRSAGDGRTGTLVLHVESNAQPPAWAPFTCDGEYELDESGAVLIRYLTIAGCGGAEMYWTWATDAQGLGRVQVFDAPGWDVAVDRIMWQSAPFVRID
jgi:TRAP-type C4-dicarboxylate transport system substrate-binding protein